MGAVLSWLSRAGTVEGRRLLIGCALDDGVNTDTVPIVGLEWGVGGAPLALLLEGGGRKLFRQVADGAVVDARPGAPLVAAIEAARTPAELAERGERRELVQAGVNPDRLGRTRGSAGGPGPVPEPCGQKGATSGGPASGPSGAARGRAGGERQVGGSAVPGGVRALSGRGGGGIVPGGARSAPPRIYALATSPEL